MREVVIASAVRTPVGTFRGALSATPPSQLASTVLREAMERAQIEAKDVDEVIVENALGEQFGEKPAQQAKSIVGFPDATGVLTINKACGLCLMLAVNAVAMGYADTVVAGGMENATQAFPSIKNGVAACRIARRRQCAGWTPRCCDRCTLAMVDRGNVSPEESEMFTFTSHQRALKAITEDKLRSQTVLVETKGEGDTRIVVDKDEISATAKDERVTVSQFAKVADGAAALVIMSKEKAEKFGVRPVARVIAWGLAGNEPEEYLMAPTLAIPKVLKQAGLEAKDIDLYEIDEVCSPATVSILKRLGINMSKVNVWGGSLALGYPLGAVAGILSTSLLFSMEDQEARTGMIALSLGGRDAASLIVKRL